MVKKVDELSDLIAQLKLGGKELPVQHYMNIACEECVELSIVTSL